MAARMQRAMSRLFPWQEALPQVKLDLSDNDLIVDYSGTSPLSTIKSQIITAYGSGTWTGNGVTSANAGSIAADSGNMHKTGLGYGEASAVLGISGSGTATFSGQTVD